MRLLTALSLAVAVAASSGAALAAHTASSAPSAAPTLLRLDGIGPLRLGMTRQAAVATGWLAKRGTGCPLGGPPLPVTYRVDGPKAPAAVDGTAEFSGDRLRSLVFGGGVRTAAGVVVGSTTAAQMVARYRAAGLGARSQYDDTFVGTFVTIGRKGKQVMGGFAEKGPVTLLGIPFVPLCE